ncbi:SIS domain-containing protein [Micromonospora sp. PPF5-17]|uniref:SIS domain-containing protein n=2 Tax=Micromonospora TaxID=1873 RepID=A0ABX9WLD2_9ACTN|nr:MULTISPECIES: SIS domain-containing protein [Micromonospora]NES35219.1 SIS domain-containing protein [Micromonospora solifontis]NES55214.1 SIS domain-containing protein [Micromonospora sp. PPF5-6]RNM01195.1 SIS domain-containing protein [Micromonospora solifontis]
MTHHDDTLDAHLSGLAAALLPYRREAARLADWGTELAWTLARGGRLLVAGNGGSAAEAQHLTAELVGKLRDDREPLSAIALHAETSALTAIGNDYGYDEVYARGVRAHGRPDDILLLMSTSGTSTNLLTAARAGRDTGLRCWAFTGPAPNPLAELCDDVLAVPSPDSQVVQELHLVATHLLCEYVDQALPLIRQLPAAPVPAPRSARFGRWTPPPSAAPATAGPATYGHATNGHRANGHGTNGHATNGHAHNGHGPTGTGWAQS